MFEKTLKNFHFLNYFLAFLILVALLFLARNVVTVSLSKKGAAPVASKGVPTAAMKKEDIMQYSVILEKNPFGRPMKLNPLAPKQEAEKPLGSLSDLTLIGTVVGPEKMSYAIFEDRSQPNVQELFAYKEKVFNYGILTKISRSSVEIRRDSETYTVSFPSDEARTRPQTRPETRAENGQGSFARKLSDREYVLDSRSVQQSLENPEQILTDARLLPNFVDGRQEGFKISEVVPDGLYHSLGIRNGDVLLRVNGLEISNPEVAIQAMTALKGMNKVNLDIVRDGKNMSMTYQIR